MRETNTNNQDPKNNDLKIMYSHNSDHWATPKEIYNWYMKQGFIDPCPLHSKRNNLNKIYKNKKIFINPPYSDIKNWVKFIEKNIMKNELIHLLIPARTDTKYFHELLKLKPIIFFIKGRLHFNDKGSAPFPSIILSFTKDIFKVSFTLPTYFKLDPKDISEKPTNAKL